jgi:hypothetical protein
VAEGYVVIVAAVDVEPIGVGELAFVPIGRHQPRRDDHVGWDDLPGQRGLDRGHSAHLGERRAVPQYLLDGGLHQRAVGMQLLPHLGVLIDAQHGVAEQRGGGDVPGDQQHDGEVHHLDVRQPLTIDLDLG